jgi:uncharacterized protein with GYD domain
MRRRKFVANYVSLVNFTDQGIRTAKEQMARLRQNEQGLAQHGIKLTSWYLTMGAYDIVATFEAPDDETAAKAMLTLGGQGNVRTTTLRAFSRDEAEKILGALP